MIAAAMLIGLLADLSLESSAGSCGASLESWIAMDWERPEVSIASDAEPAVIDLLALYTPLALRRASSQAAIEHVVRNAVDATNLVLANSGVNAVIRLIAVEMIEYVEQPNPADFVRDRDWLSFDPAVMALRATHHADAVALFTEIPSGSSTTARGEALPLVKRNIGSLHAAAVGTVNTLSVAVDVLGHEVGHTLGGDHALQEAAAASRVAIMLTPEAHDYVLPAKRVVTILAGIGCPGCVRRPYFASPSILYEGSPLGVVGESDNAGLFRITAPVMASYRNEAGPAGYFEFETDPIAVRGDESAAIVRIARHDGASGAASVFWRTRELPNEAVAHLDFTPVSGELAWSHGEDGVKAVAIPLSSNHGGTAEKQFIVELYAPTGGAVLNHGSMALVTILHPGRAREAGFIEFGAGEFHAESGGIARVSIRRVGGSAGTISTNVYALEGSARNGRDFDVRVMSLTWAHGDGADKTFLVPTQRDFFTGAPRTVKLRFNTLPSAMGYQSSAVLMIHAPKPPPRRRAVGR